MFLLFPLQPVVSEASAAGSVFPQQQQQQRHVEMYYLDNILLGDSDVLFFSPDFAFDDMLEREEKGDEGERKRFRAQEMTRGTR